MRLRIPALGFGIFITTLSFNAPARSGWFYLERTDVAAITRDLSGPAAGSDLDQEDLQAVLEIQRKRTPADCARAESEMSVAIESFFGNRSLLSAAEMETARPILERAEHDVDEAVWVLKQKTGRVRPHLRAIPPQTLAAGKTTPCPGVPANYNPGSSFPSGHSAIAYIQGLVLSELFPERKAAIMKRAEEVGFDRVVLGVHHPSDVRAGFEIARRAFDLFKKRQPFQDALRKARAALAERSNTPVLEQ